MIYFVVARSNEYALSRYNFKPVTKERIYVMMIPGAVSILFILGAIGSTQAARDQMAIAAGIVMLGTMIGMLWFITSKTNFWIGLLSTWLLFLIGSAGFGLVLVYLIYRFVIKDDKKEKEKRRGFLYN